MRLNLFIISWGLVALATALYVVWGLVSDIAARYLQKRRARALEVLSIILFETDDEAETVHQEVLDLPRRQLLEVLQSLAVDLDGIAQARLQQLVRTTGIEKFIRRRARSRRWRVRVQAAQLQYLVTHPDFDRRQLLNDPKPLIRARAVESLMPDQVGAHVELLMNLLHDESPAVRLAAQQTMLRAGPIVVPRLLGHLEGSADDVLLALEVAANLPDPRLVNALDRHASSQDPVIRNMAAKALGNGSDADSVEILHRLLDDDGPTVRATAVDSLARIEARTSAHVIGQKLSDRSFQVRRAAGQALDQLGPPGRLVLRQHLNDPDRFGRDMARQVLDAAAARTGLSVVPPLNDPLEGLSEVDEYLEIAKAVRAEFGMATDGQSPPSPALANGRVPQPDPVFDLNSKRPVGTVLTKAEEVTRGAVSSLVEQGRLTNAGAITDEDISAMLFLAVSSAELVGEPELGEGAAPC